MRHGRTGDAGAEAFGPSHGGRMEPRRPRGGCRLSRWNCEHLGCVTDSRFDGVSSTPGRSAVRESHRIPSWPGAIEREGNAGSLAGVEGWKVRAMMSFWTGIPRI